MAEATEVQQGAENGQGDGEKDEGRVPYARFEEVVKARQKAEERLKEIEDRLTEHEDRNKTETERERAARERAEQRAVELENQVTGLQKGSWVRAAAASLDFHDPEDAVAFLRDRLAGFEDESDAKRAVRNLAKDRAHLVKAKEEEKRPNLTTVFQGQQAAQQNGQQQPMTPAQRAAQQEVEFAQGLAGELGRFRDKWQSMPGGGFMGGNG
jgi:hypothetical protein